MAMRARLGWVSFLAVPVLGGSVALGQGYQWNGNAAAPVQEPAIAAAPTSMPRTGPGLEGRIASLKQQMATDRATKAEVDAELSALGGKRKHARARAHQRGRSLYRVSRSGMLPLAGGMDALLSHASRVTRLQRLVREDLDELERLRKRGHKLRRSTAELGERLERNRLEIAQLTEAQRGLQRERQAASLFERAFAGNSGFTAPAAPDDRLQYGTLRVVGGGGSQRFVDQRGQLALPISGPNQVREARRDESDGLGLEMVGSVGTAVRAVAAGRVAFSDRYGSYGRLVILDHGERYYSVYGGLGQVDVRVGDDLSRSARLGSLESEPLYFEVRRGTRNQDARRWLGL